MQKFTRPLTREIDLGGQRLAMTLSADGIEIRPLGSRKQPWSWSWPAVLSALIRPDGGLVAPESAQLSAVLELLKAVQPRAEGGTAVARVTTLDTMLEQLQVWLSKHRLTYREALYPPATEVEFGKLTDALGVPVPDELHTLLGWHNGQRRDFVGCLEESWRLMSTVEIAAAAAGPPKGQADWQPGWIPFLDDDAGNYLCLDAREKSSCPIRVYVPNEAGSKPPVAASLTAWVEAFVAALDRGEYTADKERGTLVRTGPKAGATA